MAKVAFLVDYSVRTRVVVDVDEDIDMFDEGLIVAAAREKILSNPDAYIIYDNVVDIFEDEEMPYDDKFDK